MALSACISGHISGVGGGEEANPGGEGHEVNKKPERRGHNEALKMDQH